jgi:small subunit ribosomal protein S6
VAQQAPLYDLTLLLSMTAADEQRAKLLADVESAISKAGGQIERNDDWGRRPTAFQINHQAEAEYHLLQFTAPPETIADLSHTLHITDGVLRFRVIKNRPGTPPAPSTPPPVVAAAAAPSPGAASAAPAAPAAAESAEAVAEAVAADGGAPSADAAPPEADDAADE